MPEEHLSTSWQARRTRRSTNALAGLPHRHLLFGLLLAAAVTMRVMTQFAYRPALIYFDSPSYLSNAADLRPEGFRPLGYPLLLAALLHVGDLSLVPAVQHVLVLAVTILLYATLLRRGLWPWLAALAAAPLLLDGFQLNLEQWIMSDSLFEALLVAGFCALAWNRRPTWSGCLIGGTALSLAVSVRLVGVFLLVPAVLYVLLATPMWPRRVQRLLALCTAFAVPLTGYAAWFTATNDRFGISGSSGALVYARAASFVDCDRVDLPAYERPLCPSKPKDQRMSTNDFAWSPRSPAAHYAAPAGMDRDAVLGDFARRVFRAQPLDYLGAIAGDFLQGFHWGRPIRRQDVQKEYWRFTRAYPPYPTANTASHLTAEYGGGPPAVQRDLAGFLRGYQTIADTRGPFLALALLLAVAAACGLGRSRRSGLRSFALLWSGGGFLVTVGAFAAMEFTWRYQLLTITCYPVAGAIGLFALLGGRPLPGRTGGAAAQHSPPGPAPLCFSRCRLQPPQRLGPPHRSTTP